MTSFQGLVQRFTEGYFIRIESNHGHLECESRKYFSIKYDQQLCRKIVWNTIFTGSTKLHHSGKNNMIECNNWVPSFIVLVLCFDWKWNWFSIFNEIFFVALKRSYTVVIHTMYIFSMFLSCWVVSLSLLFVHYAVIHREIVIEGNWYAWAVVFQTQHSNMEETDLKR